MSSSQDIWAILRAQSSFWQRVLRPLQYSARMTVNLLSYILSMDLRELDLKNAFNYLTAKYRLCTLNG